ncbi:FadR/GntR family transcriptional regulator [Anoxybacillus sp. FSL W8-0382]|uniref:FadR/GntR family transcriptional regulator n=1 Tax=Anoxybacillus TaxID=150247 RepID=UPI0007D90D65|nr:FadR/GntR family transcriptional regulator [Anoxybacillus flavithermus]MBE2939914.1 FadR family transcriptional regulator [Anoxybacillus flavithermus]MBE2942743.1 FadR family transcriptional regulator [Anoxybacillus flavithermus]MBE2950821.1 FadR family transcriptional regulator [Anoxybacillus flavithermus]MBE2953708.1 FadR family transcriptional regulator [Anoxybacillus flavithermus]MBE2958833.1 FadR family transcriptional regulator [Anoxybacillus flavithermus]
MDNVYKQIKPKKIYEEVAEAILHMIQTGQLKPGDKLDSVQQLAENFQVGRAAIREALTALRAMGLIEMKQGEGTYVREFDPAMLSFPISAALLMNKEDVAHLLEVRKLLEVGAAGLAALKRTEEDLRAMQSALAQMREVIGDEELGEKADFLFHMAIAEATKNPLLVSLMNNVSGMMMETMRETRRIWLFAKQTTTEQLLEDHIAIFEAIREQNIELAQERMKDHLGHVEKVLSDYISL